MITQAGRAQEHSQNLGQPRERSKLSVVFANGAAESPRNFYKQLKQIANRRFNGIETVLGTFFDDDMSHCGDAASFVKQFGGLLERYYNLQLDSDGKPCDRCAKWAGGPLETALMFATDAALSQMLIKEPYYGSEKETEFVGLTYGDTKPKSLQWSSKKITQTKVADSDVIKEVAYGAPEEDETDIYGTKMRESARLFLRASYIRNSLYFQGREFLFFYDKLRADLAGKREDFDRLVAEFRPDKGIFLAGNIAASALRLPHPESVALQYSPKHFIMGAAAGAYVNSMPERFSIALFSKGKTVNMDCREFDKFLGAYVAQCNGDNISNIEINHRKTL